MLCSARELGLGEEHDGILELDTDAAPGTPLPRRAAAGRHAARRGRHAQPPGPPVPQGRGARALGVVRDAVPPAADSRRRGARRARRPPRRRDRHGGGVRIAIEDAESCPRFHAAVIRGAAVGPSPEWLRRRLEAVGVRSINNVVDATNYVMFELNQPMHAYDLARLRGGRAGRAPRADRRAARDARRRRAPAHAGDGGDRRRRGRDRHRRHHGRREHRGGPREPGHPARGRLVESRPDPPHPTRSQPQHRGQLPVRAGDRPAGAARPRCAAASSWCWRRRAATLVETAARPLARADAPAADLPPPRTGGAGARRRAAMARARAAPGGDRRDRREQARRRPDRGGRAGLAAGPRARDRPGRGDRPAARLRQRSRRTSARSGRQPAGRPGGGGERRRSAAGSWPRGSTRS